MPACATATPVSEAFDQAEHRTSSERQECEWTAPVDAPVDDCLPREELLVDSRWRSAADVPLGPAPEGCVAEINASFDRYLGRHPVHPQRVIDKALRAIASLDCGVDLELRNLARPRLRERASWLGSVLRLLSVPQNRARLKASRKRPICSHGRSDNRCDRWDCSPPRQLAESSARSCVVRCWMRT